MYINAYDNEDQQKSVSINYYPDECPICHHSTSPVLYSQAYYNSAQWNKDDCLQMIFRCPRIVCQKLFIANYKTRDSNCVSFFFRNCLPVTKIGREFSETIENISENFCTIYNQSLNAEQDGLLEVCGVGYRKSLEFLIKDYLISLEPTQEKEIKKKYLGRCISDDIKNENIKNVAERATWLGNDETHYLRKWEGKDLEDLKKLIDLTVHWLEMDALTEEVIKDMPKEANITPPTETDQ